MAKRSLGQNFLTDLSVVNKLISALQVKEDDIVLEIGPGRGAITFVVSKKAKAIIAIEKDDKLFALLSDKIHFRNLKNTKIVHQNILDYTPKLDDYKIVGSLPYNISKEIIYNMLFNWKNWQKAVFIIQKEVAEDYVSTYPNISFLSRVAYLRANAKIVSYISPNAFIPHPKVHGAITTFTPKKRIFNDTADEIGYLSFAKTIYQFKRKKLKNCLKFLLKRDKISNANIEIDNSLLDLRPEQIKQDLFINIYKKIMGV